MYIVRNSGPTTNNNINTSTFKEVKNVILSIKEVPPHHQGPHHLPATHGGGPHLQATHLPAQNGPGSGGGAATKLAKIEPTTPTAVLVDSGLADDCKCSD